MMKTWNFRGGFYRVFVPATGLLAFGGCSLSDQQLTGIFSSVVTSGLSTLLNTLLAGLVGTP